jgi:NAD-dependent deacetylase
MISKDIQQRIVSSKRVCVFTGAGVSAESGIPTFRDSGGLWENYRAEDLVTPEAFAQDPVVVWRWHAWLQELSFRAQPNAAHKTIAEMDRAFPDFLLITQNIDDLHERAGTRRMVKIHGDIMQMSCLDHGHMTHFKEPIGESSITGQDSLPKCPICGSMCRPDVVWFGELLPMEPLERARSFCADCDLFLIVGTSGVVSGGYGFAQTAKASGALIIEVNPEETALSHLADVTLRSPAAQIVPLLFTNNSYKNL